MQSSGADVVGYDELLFWRITKRTRLMASVPAGMLTTGGGKILSEDGEAWIYRNKLAKAGSSFCYWRRMWEGRPFPEQPRPGVGQGEDYAWAQGLNMARVSAFGKPYKSESLDFLLPRLICSIHGGNTSRGYDDIQESPSWQRVPEFDGYCRERMAL